MVSAEKNYEDQPTLGGSGKRSKQAASKRPQLKRDSSATGDGIDDDDNIMRIGGDFQAVIPEYPRGIERYPESLPEKALLVWQPSPDTSETKLDEFLITAKEKYGYNAEQALGMLFWHKHDLAKAFIDLPNFTPFPDEWTVEDKVLFEQAFQFHGKSFTRIRQMLPDKSVASLVKYYYSWKKTRCRTSLMDRQARKRANQKEEGGDAVSEEMSNSESDADGEKNEKENPSSNKVSCANCSVLSSLTQSTPKGHLCPSCYHYWRRTGSLKPTNVASKKLDPKDRHGTLKSKRKPPRGMHLNHEDLNGLALGPPTQGDSILKSMDSEVISLKRRVQNNKQIVSALKHKTLAGIDDFRPSESLTRLNSRWLSEELLLAVQGVRQYGKDFKAIAELIGNKSEAHIRSFFVNYRRRFNLDAVVQEYEAENGPIVENEETDNKMDIDISSDHSGPNSGTSTPVRGGTPSAAPPPPPTSGTATTTAGSSLMSSNVPPPLLKPAQSPSIMNRSVHSSQATLQQQSNRFPSSSRSNAPQQPPPPLIARPASHNQPTQLSSRE